MLTVTAIRLRLARVAVIAILIVTAIPAGLRDPRTIDWHFIFSFRDAIGNILLYWPLGLFLQPATTLRSVTAFAGSLSVFIEIAQLFFISRNTQPTDLVCNVLGAACGWAAGRYLDVRSDRVKVGSALGLAAIAAAVVWSAAYLSIWRILPPFAGRGSIAVVAFLSALGLAGMIKPRSRYSRFTVGVIGGAIGAVVLLPASRMPRFSTMALGVLLGFALVYCTNEPRPD